MRLKVLKQARKIYFIGVGGVSMSALAKLLSVYNYSVSGSDGVKSEALDSLAFYGVQAFVGEEENRRQLLEADVVVITDAIPKEHVELVAARRCQKRILSRSELLEGICREFSNVVAVAGSHGKTTCASMCAHVLKSCGVPFTAHIGGEDSYFSNFYYNGEDYLITEACEYKRNLLKIPADSAVLLNVDNDHMECYQDGEDLTRCFYQFCAQAKTAFVCADDERCAKFGFSTFGIKNPLADYRATEIRKKNERYSFTVEEYGKALCRVKLQAIGYCNVYNALAAFAAMRSYGFSEREIVSGLEGFVAVKRRFERIGRYCGVEFICDYAHHPREILSTVLTARGVCKGNLYVVFQPHTYSRTKLLLREFVEVLQPIENLIIYKTFPAREKYDAMGSAEVLVREIGSCLYAENISVLKTWLEKTVKEGDAVLFLGAGDIYFAAQYLLRELT